MNALTMAFVTMALATATINGRVKIALFTRTHAPTTALEMVCALKSLAGAFAQKNTTACLVKSGSMPSMVRMLIRAATTAQAMDFAERRLWQTSAYQSDVFAPRILLTRIARATAKPVAADMANVLQEYALVSLVTLVMVASGRSVHLIATTTDTAATGFVFAKRVTQESIAICSLTKPCLTSA